MHLTRYSFFSATILVVVSFPGNPICNTAWCLWNLWLRKLFTACVVYMSIVHGRQNSLDGKPTHCIQSIKHFDERHHNRGNTWVSRYLIHNRWKPACKYGCYVWRIIASKAWVILILWSIWFLSLTIVSNFPMHQIWKRGNNWNN